MKDSYIMVNPKGELIKAQNSGYEVLGSLLTGDIISMIEKLGFNMEVYNRRYT